MFSELAATLKALHVPTEDSRDETKAERFFVIGLYEERVVTRKRDPDYWY